jgi:L-ascorbate metabolism protein UlaG (beta-lactamase superfamily)
MKLDRRQFIIGAGALAAAAKPADVRIQRLAWAGVRLQLPDATLIIDPLINADVWGSALGDRLVPVDDGDGVRFVLVTHRHSDHSDPASIAAALGKDGTLVHGAGMTAPIGGARTRVAALYEPLLLGDFTVTAVPASDGYGDPQVSWVVSGGGRRVFHGGDTMIHGNWWHIGRQLGPFDAAFLPINGARFSWRQPASAAPAVLTPEQAVDAAVILGARRLVPIHYGVTGADGYTEAEDVIGTLAAAARRRSLRVDFLAPGDWLDWAG